VKEGIDYEEVAKLCIGMSGADLSNILNEAAILAARNQKHEISISEIKDAINKVQIGLEIKGK
jgi:cell division protease FtsH